MLLLRFLKVYEFDLEKAQKLLLLNLEMRKKNPALVLNRDIFSDKMKRASESFEFISMKKCNNKNQNITIMYLHSWHKSRYFWSSGVNAFHTRCIGRSFRYVRKCWIVKRWSWDSRSQRIFLQTHNESYSMSAYSYRLYEIFTRSFTIETCSNSLRQLLWHRLSPHLHHKTIH